MGYYKKDDLAPLYASGVRRVAAQDKPDRSQPYQTMELMQWNYFMDQGVLTFDAKSGRLSVHQDKFHAAVTAMLRDVLELQAAGDARKRPRPTSRSGPRGATICTSALPGQCARARSFATPLSLTICSMHPACPTRGTGRAVSTP
jgi:hypothetical protein